MNDNPEIETTVEEKKPRTRAKKEPTGTPSIPTKRPIITNWKPKPSETLVTYNGSIFLILFEKLFEKDKYKLSVYDEFYIKKDSYKRQLETITNYINYFMNFYDPEHEMAVAYCEIKYAIDKEKRFNEKNPGQLIDLIYEVFFTDTIIQKICDLVDDNYLDDIESADDTKKYAGKNKKHLESLEFTNQHIKILLRISFGMKCIAPILFHYIAINGIKLDKDSDMIYNFYRKLFDIFSGDTNMYNKLFVYVNVWRTLILFNCGDEFVRCLNY